MLRDYWYVCALGIVASIISILTNQVFLLVLFLVWVIGLRICNRINILFCFIACAVPLFFYFYFPVIDNDLPETETNKVSNIAGEVISPPLFLEHRVEFEVMTSEDEKILVTYFKNNEDADLDLNTLHHGATCSITGQTAVPKQATNPHQFDYALYLQGKGITSQFLPDHLTDIKCSGRSLLSYIYSFRNYLINQTEIKLEPETVKWLHALVLGDDSQLDNDVILIFQRWGLSHILAISGLHIGIIVGLIYFIFIRFSILTKEKTALLLIFFLPVYAFIAGGQPSVWRASIMVLVAILLTMFRFRLNYTDILSITFIILIILDKFIIYHVGFQLSFAVTFGIILSKNWLASSKTAIETLFKLSFISQMTILPLQLHYFSVFDPLSILMNIIAVPYFSLFVIPFMFALLIFSWLPSSLLHVLEIIFHILHDRVLSFVLFADQYFHFPFIIGKLNIILVIVYYILLLLVMTASEKKQMILAFRYGLLLCIFIVFLAVRPYLSPYGTVTMLDIGQGDAFIIELPYRKGVYFVDIGAQVTFPDFEATDKTYRQIIKPYLYGQGISHIDGVFLSHEDLDHDGSLQYLLEDFPVKEIIVSEYYKLDEERLSVWTRKGNPIIKRVQHAEVIDRPDMKMYVLGPRKETDSANENSLVLYTELGGLSWLFTGDIGKDTEKELISHYKDVTLDVLKVAHHGSKHSTDKALVKKVKHVAWISAGRNNTYGHPTEEVLHNLREENLKIYRTDQDGAVQYKFKGEKGIFKSFNN